MDDNKFFIWLVVLFAGLAAFGAAGSSIHSCIEKRENRAAVERCIEKTQNLDKCAEIFQSKDKK